ncbi:MAG TPA: TetR family transcriptional regulator [Rhizomicrobium sp.]|jgi:TPR repeat protein|nr:TetR family transcriptional regulator [Rhizomicrobium sp.]
MGSQQADTRDSRLGEEAAICAAILAAARRVAERDGILGMSLIGVAQDARVDAGAVYGLFSSKNDLLLAVIADDLATLARAMQGAFSADEHRSDGEEGPDAPAAPQALLPAPETDAQSGSDADASASPQTQESQPPAQAPAGPMVAAEETSRDTEAPDAAVPAETLARLQETVARLEKRPVDAWLERRLREFERALAALEGQHVERNTTETTLDERLREFHQGLEALEQRLRTAMEEGALNVSQRLDNCENRLRECVSDGQADAATLARRLTALENAAFATKPEFFVAKADMPPGPVATPELSSPLPAWDSASAGPIGGAAGESPASYLAAARRSAQAAAIVHESHKRKPAKRKSDTLLYLAMGSLFLFVAMLTAAGLLLRGAATGDTIHGNHRIAVSATHAATAHAPQPDVQTRLRRLAEAGDPEADLLMGLEYLDRRGAAANEQAAFDWLSRAAARNQPLAQYDLGLMYENGRGVKADAAQAFHWFESAALKGNRRAMHSLATAYAEGWGAPKNLTEAARWFARAAQLGSVNDQFNLGVLYERGMGVPESLPDAYKWYAVAAAQGDQESQVRIAALGPTFAPEDLAAARSAAASFKPEPLVPAANFPPTLVQTRK